TVGAELAREFCRRLRVGREFLPERVARGRLLCGGGCGQPGQHQTERETPHVNLEMARHRSPLETNAVNRTACGGWRERNRAWSMGNEASRYELHCPAFLPGCNLYCCGRILSG